MMTEQSDPLVKLGQMVRDHNDRAIAALDVQGTVEKGLSMPRRTRAWRLLLPVAAVFAVLCGVFLARHLFVHDRAVSYRVLGRPGAVDEWLSTSDEGQSQLEFSEGSTVLVRQRTWMRVRDLGPKGASVELGSGLLAVAVAHREDSHWKFHAGPYLVWVTGTRFDISWNPSSAHLELSLQDGSVMLEGPGFPRRTVIAGEHVVLSAKPAPSAASASVDLSGGRLSTPPPQDNLPLRSSATALPSSSAPQPRLDWRGHASQGRYGEALAAANAQGFDQLCATLPAVELQQLGDVARFAGNPTRAQQAYQSIRNRFRGSDAAAQAAFDLGVVTGSVTWFDAYLQERPSGPLAREALGRKLESAHAARSADALPLAQQYLLRYPSGPHATLAKVIVEQQRP